MNSFSLDTITTQFYNAGVHYSAAIQPYALNLFFALFLIDIIVTWIQYTAEGQLDPSFFLGRLLKHILSGGFVYLRRLRLSNDRQRLFVDVPDRPKLLAHRLRDQRPARA